jgi:hypothetical protein
MNFNNNVKILQEISENLDHNCSNLKEVSEIYFRTKEIFFGNISSDESLIAQRIFLNCYVKLNEYLLERETKDLNYEEIEILLDLSDEFLNNLPLFSNSQGNSMIQRINEFKQILLKEKVARLLQKNNNNNSGDDLTSNTNNGESNGASKSSREKELEKELTFLVNQRKEALLRKTEKGSSEKGSSEKGSSEKGSSEKGSSEKGSSEKGSSEKGSSESKNFIIFAFLGIGALLILMLSSKIMLKFKKFKK